jgi:4-amino-4-deoxy-L-arabinose transferase-like glycosyltransferase
MNIFLSTFKKATGWIKQHPWEVAILAVVLLVAAVMRLYRIDGYMIFLGDQGRDAIVVRRLLVNYDPILVGPGTSVGNMYLGPLYYYLMAPVLYLAGYSPVGPAVMVALLSVATVFMIWFVGRKWFGVWAGLVASGLYAISPAIIDLANFSWNPNIMPFFSLLAIYSIWKFWRENRFGWMVVAAICLAFVLQSHYLGLLLVPTVILFCVLTLFRLRVAGYGLSNTQPTNTKQKNNLNRFLWYSFLGLVVFLVLMSPLVVFDARHSWRNLAAIRNFFVRRQALESNLARSLAEIPGVIKQIATRLLGAKSAVAGKWILALMSLPALIVLIERKRLRRSDASAYLVLAAWLIFGFIGLAFYKGEIYDHYFGFLFPAPFLLFGGFVSFVLHNLHQSGKALVVGLVIFLSILNLSNLHFRFKPNRQLAKTQEVVAKIIAEADGERFNFGVIADRNYEGAYQYFLESWSAPFVMIDAQRADETIMKQLFVVCEYQPFEKCQPTSNPKAEVANFGWSKIADKWEVADVVVFKLVHSR